MIRIRNWDKWQSYRRDRGQPPWIKVHRQIMRDPNWVVMTASERGQLVALWLLAADRDGEIPSDTRLIKKLCFMDGDEELNLQRFVDLGFLEPDDSVTPERRQDDAPETETEAEENREEKRVPNGTLVARGDVRKAFENYNRAAEQLDLPVAAKLTPERERKLRARLTEHGLKGWNQALQNLCEQPFCLGKGGRGWRASLDFLLQPSSLNKVLEKAYAHEGDLN